MGDAPELKISFAGRRDMEFLILLFSCQHIYNLATLFHYRGQKYFSARLAVSKSSSGDFFFRTRKERQSNMARMMARIKAITPVPKTILPQSSCRPPILMRIKNIPSAPLEKAQRSMTLLSVARFTVNELYNFHPEDIRLSSVEALVEGQKL